MIKKLLLLASAVLFSVASLDAKAKPRAKGKPRSQAAAKSADLDLNLVNFSRQPFSDHASHITVLRKEGGLASWDVMSATAFGSEAAKPGPAKKLFNFRVELEAGTQGAALFPAGISATAEDYPRWSKISATDAGIVADAVLLYPEQDALVLALNFVNRSKVSVRVRPRLLLSGNEEGVDSTVKLDSKGGVLSLTVDRSKLVQRKLKESICVLAGSGKSLGYFSAASMKGAENLSDTPLVGLGGFTVTMLPSAGTVLKPGQALRFPVAFTFAPDEKSARLPMGRIWTRWALPKGEALSKARARWNLTTARLPKAVNPAHERLLKASALTLLMNQYGRRAELKNDMISQAKGYRDAFFSDGLPLAALGYSELDHGLAEAALLELGSFSAAAPAPVPPHTGEELLLWEAAGLPLHGLAAWELYLRDPELGRAGDFLKGAGLHLRNESAWWPSHRDGDGNGLYAYGSDEEKPWYLTQDKAAPVGQPTLQTYSLALSSLVAWQMQAASALALAVGDKAEAEKLTAESAKIASAMKRLARGADGVYEQGLDGLLPYILGLDTELGMARSALGNLTRSAREDSLPFTENGVFHPWRAYLMLRGLSLYGEHAAARVASDKILGFLNGKAAYSAYSSDGQGLGAPGDASTAAVTLEMALERHEQEAFLLADTTALSGRFLQIRSPDGAIYIKRVGLSEAKAAYESISLASVNGGPILSEGGFVLSSASELRISLLSQWGLDLSEEKSKREIFKGTKRADFILKPKTRYLVKIIK